ncbi:hypothetical protein LTR16_000252 [Cryomyces antarcticus]|uniref:Uncharacterized protein n=1 Tax=Cryomyces antarcticus TaxID=329879 RepID=A0ABR0M2C0_9PEZI|nr:hypothetical protein LTR39_000131 [Cryomyces antarcticus]KAK5257567.1 hypothetical protein LTR16_000252 [Cryomyces antarcticus]
MSLCAKKPARIGHDLEACTTVLSPSVTVFLFGTVGIDDTNRVSAGNCCVVDKLGRVSDNEGTTRETQLKYPPEFWGCIVKQGSRVIRHTNDRASAISLIELSLPKQKITLDLQQQIVDEKKTLDQTSAGQELEVIIIQQREMFAKELQEVREQMQEALKLKDGEVARALYEMQNEKAEHLERLEKDRQELRISMEKLFEERFAKLVTTLQAPKEIKIATQAGTTKPQNLEQAQLKKPEKSKNPQAAAQAGLKESGHTAPKGENGKDGNVVARNT